MKKKYYLESNIFSLNTLRKFYKNMNIFDVVGSGDLESLKKLVSGGANVEAKDKYGNTPLIYASRLGFLEIVKYLIEECNANVNVKNRDESTPLITASINGHLEIVKYLIENGANYEELLESLEEQGHEDERNELEKIILEVADTRIKFITSDKY